jgi:hypothetical protein
VAEHEHAAMPVDKPRSQASSAVVCTDAACLFERSNVVTAGVGEPCLDVEEMHAYTAAVGSTLTWLTMQRTQRACCRLLGVCGACVSRVDSERIAECMYGSTVQV